MKYYEILDLTSDATHEQIRAAYRILVQLHHPDRLHQASPPVRAYAEERLKKINEAYTVLSDPARRAKYDASLRGSARRAEYEAPDEAAAAPRRGRRYGSRYQSAEQAEYQAAYDEWEHQQAERYAEARQAERAQRAAREAEHERQEAEARARRAAEEQFPRARAQGDELIVYFAPGIWTALVRVPAGEFVMGSNPEQDSLAAPAEQPQHRVALPDYYVGKYPVTNSQFQVFAEAVRLDGPGQAWQLPPGKETHPTVNVSWDAAAAFCQWLSAATGRTFRLPTEAEWEKAARGDDGRRYAWGDAWDPVRLNAEGGPGDTTPVGHFSPAGDSPYGLADMCGNVWEWCGDWYADDAYQQRRGRRTQRSPASGEGFVVRGGAFDSSARQARCAQRNWYYAFNTRKNLGFRIVAEPFGS